LGRHSCALHKIFREELSDILANVYDMVTEIPKYGNVKTGHCKERRKFWLLSKIRKKVLELCFRKEFYVRQITAAFFESIEMKTGNAVLVLAGEDCEYLLTSTSYFCLDCTFKNCLRHFVQLYRLYVVPGRTSHGKNIYIRFCLHFYRVKLKSISLFVNC
jgi:hypothetical protein